MAYQLLLTAGGKLDVSFTLPPGAYFLFVDGATASDKGSFELTVDAL